MADIMNVAARSHNWAVKLCFCSCPFFTTALSFHAMPRLTLVLLQIEGSRKGASSHKEDDRPEASSAELSDSSSLSIARYYVHLQYTTIYHLALDRIHCLLVLVLFAVHSWPPTRCRARTRRERGAGCPQARRSA